MHLEIVWIQSLLATDLDCIAWITCTIHTFLAGPQLMISTSPSGPVYPAATWVRVACRYNHSQPYLLQYRWTGSCNSTGAAVFDIDEPLLDEQGWAVIWVKTTPVNCLDRFHCTVYEREQNGVLLTEIASEVFTFQHVSGKKA